jgi:hypothetical protein
MACSNRGQEAAAFREQELLDVIGLFDQRSDVAGRA